MMETGPARAGGDHWSTHLLTEFLAMVLSYSDVDTAYQRGVERIAEALEAEVGAIVGARDVLAVVGFPRRSIPVQELLDLARTRPAQTDLPHVGTCVIEVAPFDDEAGTTLLVGRLDGAAFTRAEASLLRGMTRTLLLCTRMLRTLASERALRETSEVLVGIERAIAERAPLQEVLDAVTTGAQRLLRVEIAMLQLHDPTDPSNMLLVSSQGLDEDSAGCLATAAIRDSLLAQAIIEGRLVMVSGDAPAWGDGGGTVGAMMAAPVLEGTTVIGALAIATLDRRREYTPMEQDLLSRFAEHASLALTDARTVEQLSQAMQDPLTGLANRGLFLDRLRQALDRADQTDSRIALLFGDLDGFKGINDSLGHTTGDAVLRVVADRLRHAIRENDVAARLGGDEFAILLEDVYETERATAVADRILEQMSRPMSVEGYRVQVGMSIGVVLREPGREGADELLRNADLAMYRSKEVGKNHLTVFEGWMHQRLVERVSLDADLRRAVEHDEFEVHYQPIVDLATRRPVGVEALARWNDPLRGPVPPAVFIPLAEETGLIHHIGAMVLRDACADVQAWRAELPGCADLHLSVNVSALQLHDPALVAKVRRALHHRGLPAANLVLEITESALMQDPGGVAERLRTLRALGVRVAIDDFGTGYSSLSYLRAFPADVLKIDKVFIDDIATGDATLAEGIVRLGHALGLETVAEGIEHADQALALVAMGCRLGQGYAFGRPVAALEMSDVLRDSGNLPAPVRTVP